MTNTKFFQFEADFVSSLRCIPMVVRYKLDTCGIKLKLSHWNHFNLAEREALVDLPCVTTSEINTYREFLQELVIKQTGAPASELAIEENPAWMDSKTIPAEVLDKAQQEGVNITTEKWAKLSPLQRFVLIKLSRPSHENSNFSPAIKEFKLMEN
ncbi:nitrate reductase associated protein [[Phormidium ambiguum] IAM M-71]|uniref:Nitrate reductase associated protein n=1 Tax=[Phormidium ambiguum] IAM M-71 TaxID=454136 RepID=A0A1U7IAF8_9CYAN|nr:nitrate reductase associated protein [Phormidium ambiguum]OKH33556.1 nitrate reductase associated protein [Phormidium ambiguum IAM M-71]